MLEDDTRGVSKLFRLPTYATRPHQHSEECDQGRPRHNCVVEDPMFVKVVLRGKHLPVLRSKAVDVFTEIHQAACRPEGGVCVVGVGVGVGGHEKVGCV